LPSWICFSIWSRPSKMISLSPVVIKPCVANDSERWLKYDEHWLNRTSSKKPRGRCTN
jgi:hypothetical protein